MTDTTKSRNKIVAYRLKIPELGGGNVWLCAGANAQSVSNAVFDEVIESLQSGCDITEANTIILEPYETTQEEIDNLPEHPGW